ncbi:hypothetical protein VP01_3221g1 [Puccinia sorghi]|uniref:Uncharacterized protein n=1 Tax=Puccinia sorghi TaxID=27349 RepID=A0A0L6UY79_9BASI|nr:hypothetical protein VP01_3221g1 [Puccinia sorghi]
MCLNSCLIYQCSTLHNLNVPLCSTPFIKKLFLAIFPMLHSLNSLRFHILNTTLPFYKILNLPTFSLNMKPKTSIFFVNHSSSTLLCYHINIVDLPIYQPKQHPINFSVSCFLIFFLIILSYPLISLKYLCEKNTIWRLWYLLMIFRSELIQFRSLDILQWVFLVVNFLIDWCLDVAQDFCQKGSGGSGISCLEYQGGWVFKPYHFIFHLFFLIFFHFQIFFWDIFDKFVIGRFWGVRGGFLVWGGYLSALENSWGALGFFGRFWKVWVGWIGDLKGLGGLFYWDSLLWCPVALLDFIGDYLISCFFSSFGGFVWLFGEAVVVVVENLPLFRIILLTPVGQGIIGAPNPETQTFFFSHVWETDLHFLGVFLQAPFLFFKWFFLDCCFFVCESFVVFVFLYFLKEHHSKFDVKTCQVT